MDLKYETIIYGCTFESVLYAWYNDLPIVYKSLKEPFPHETVQADFDVAKYFYYSHETKQQKYCLPEKIVKEFGVNKLKLFRNIYFSNSLAGLMLFSGQEVKKILWNKEEHYFDVVLNRNSFKVKYKNVIIFDDEEIEQDLKIKNYVQQWYIAVDWFRHADKNISGHIIDLIQNQNRFVHEIYFYPSEHCDANFKSAVKFQKNIENQSIKKSFCAISYLSEDQLYHSQFTSAMAKLKIQLLFLKYGFKGKPKGIYVMKNGTRREMRDKPRIVFIERQIRKLVDLSQYDDEKSVKINTMSEKDIINNYHNLEYSSARLLLKELSK